MSGLFLKIVNMSISASWLVLAVLLLRSVLKRAPKWICVLLWGFVAIRLICPFSLESMLSLIPSAETIHPEIMMDPAPQIHTGIGPLNSVINPIVSESFAPTPGDSMNPLQFWIPLAVAIWLAGIAAMVIYAAVSYLLLRHRVDTAVLFRNNIYQSENVDSPFVLGIIKPKIYVPFQMDGQNLEHVIAHEEAHIHRRDHWWKPFGFALLALHWFNPLMWLGYILLCRDIELACDEKVIKNMDSDSKASYTEALVACSINRRRIAACPLAFGEVGVKERVKSVLNYKKPAFWIIIAAVVICAVVAVCFLTNPKEKPALPDIDSQIYVVEEVTYYSGDYSFQVTAGENSPIYSISEDMSLASQKEYSQEGVWTRLGKLEEMNLTIFNFDALFNGIEMWAENTSAEKIRRNTAKAWQLTYNQSNIYYILQQMNGDLYLAYGYNDVGVNGDRDSAIRWLFKLAVDHTDQQSVMAKSGDNTIPLVTFPADTPIADCLGSVHWFTFDSQEDALSTISVWRGHEKIQGTYRAYDAETGEPTEDFSPHNVPGPVRSSYSTVRKFVVLVSLSADLNAEVYAFGFAVDYKMTMDDVLELAEKGESLASEDFDRFIGISNHLSGVYGFITHYDIDADFNLTLVCYLRYLQDPRISAYLECCSCNERVYIQTDDVKAFIKAHHHSAVD